MQLMDQDRVFLLLVHAIQVMTGIPEAEEHRTHVSGLSTINNFHGTEGTSRNAQ